MDTLFNVEIYESVGHTQWMRIIDQLENGTSRALQQAKGLRLRGYDQDELGEVTRDAAAVWERSLKASNPNWTNKSLYSIIEDLKDAGWFKAAAELHVIRTSANSDKHDASPLHVVDQLVAALEVLTTELGSLQTYVPGVGNELPRSPRIRRMVCAVYEIFHAGETIYSFLEAGPTDTWQTARQIDEFQVENRNDAAIEGELAKLPNWAINPPELDDLKKSLLESDNELWRIASFDATYQQVHDIVAPHQHDLPLLIGLHREDDAFNFTASVAQSLLIGGLPDLLGRSPLDEPGVRSQLESLVANVPERLKPLRLDRCSLSRFRAEEPSAVAIDVRLGALVTDRGVLLIRAQ